MLGRAAQPDPTWVALSAAKNISPPSSGLAAQLQFQAVAVYLVLELYYTRVYGYSRGQK